MHDLAEAAERAGEAVAANEIATDPRALLRPGAPFGRYEVDAVLENRSGHVVGIEARAATTAGPDDFRGPGRRRSGLQRLAPLPAHRRLLRLFVPGIRFHRLDQTRRRDPGGQLAEPDVPQDGQLLVREPFDVPTIITHRRPPSSGSIVPTEAMSARRPGDLAGRVDPAGATAAVSAGPPLGQWGEELMQQVAVRLLSEEAPSRAWLPRHGRPGTPSIQGAR